MSKTMGDISTPADWWETLEGQWGNIIDIFGRCNAPLDSNEWREGIGMPIVPHPKSLASTLEDAKEARDHKTMAHHLELLWMAAPDAPHIHSWPGWGHLCDLCSERWVFDKPAGPPG